MRPTNTCRLYTDVISTINGYGDLLWVDVVAQIDAMNERVLTFQSSSKRLPRGLRDWPAYLECKRTIDEFLEVLPLFQQLTHKALRPRSGPQLLTCVTRLFLPIQPPAVLCGAEDLKFEFTSCLRAS